MSLKIAIILVFILPLTACTSTPKQPTAGVKVFTVPPPPAILTSPEQKAEFIATHYWDNFDFADTTLISRANITEQAFADFISLLAGGAPRSIIEKSIDTMMTRATADSAMYAHFIELSEKYLYDPNSPFRNEEVYIVVLKNIIANEQLDDIYKIRPHHQLDMALRNRVGDKATNFEYTTPEGEKSTLYATVDDPLLLFFFSPDCDDCKRIKSYITERGIDKQVKILYVNPETDTHLDAIYDLRASPTLYLLGKEKTVLLKDAPIEQIEQYMTDK